LKKLKNIPVLVKWIHWRMSNLVSEYEPTSIIDMGGVGRIKSFVNCKVVDANLKAGIDATKLPFKDNSFDISLSINTLEHIKNKKKFLLEAIRVAKVASIHWFPYGAGAKLTEKLKKELGHKHPCSIPEYQDILPFLTDSKTSCKFKESISCKDHLLLLASINEKMNNSKTFEFIEKYGNVPYSFILSAEYRRGEE